MLAQASLCFHSESQTPGHAGKQGAEGTLWHLLTRLLVLYLREAPLQQAQQAVANASFLLPMLLDLRAPSSR